MIVSRLRVSGVETFHYLINQTFQGLTIIVKQYGIVVIDVSNEMDEDTSIHFHGIRQRKCSMDGWCRKCHPVPYTSPWAIQVNYKYMYAVALHLLALLIELREGSLKFLRALKPIISGAANIFLAMLSGGWEVTQGSNLTICCAIVHQN